MGNIIQPKDEKEPLHPLLPLSLEELHKVKDALSHLKNSYHNREKKKDDWKKVSNRFMDHTIPDLERLFANIGDIKTGKHLEKWKQGKTNGESYKEHGTDKNYESYDRKRHPKQDDSYMHVRLESCQSEIDRLNKETKAKSETVEKLGNRVQALTVERDDLQRRLSSEWETKVSKDERNIENVSIKNRPMKVAEEYDTLCSHTWLTAKESIDKILKEHTWSEMVGSNLQPCTEEDKVTLLRNIMMQAEEIAKLKYKKVANHIFEMLTIQAEKGASTDAENTKLSRQKSSDKPGDNGIDKTYANIPDGLRNAIGDFLRTTSDTSDISGILEEIKCDLKHIIKSDPTACDLEATLQSKTLTEEMSRTLLAAEKKQITKHDLIMGKLEATHLSKELTADMTRTLTATPKSPTNLAPPHSPMATLPMHFAASSIREDTKEWLLQEILKKYIADFGRLAWKMVTQRPQMKFDIESGVGQRWRGEKYQEVAYNSKDPTDSKNVVKYYVHPALMHDKAVMKIGRVYIA